MEGEEPRIFSGVGLEGAQERGAAILHLAPVRPTWPRHGCLHLLQVRTDCFLPGSLIVAAGDVPGEADGEVAVSWASYSVACSAVASAVYSAAGRKAADGEVAATGAAACSAVAASAL